MNANENQLEEDIPIVTEGGSHEGDTNPLSIQNQKQVAREAQVQKEKKRLNEIASWGQDS